MSKDEIAEVMVRIKPSVNEDIKTILDNNNVFTSAGEVIEFAIKQLKQRGSVR